MQPYKLPAKKRANQIQRWFTGPFWLVALQERDACRRLPNVVEPTRLTATPNYEFPRGRAALTSHRGCEGGETGWILTVRKQKAAERRTTDISRSRTRGDGGDEGFKANWWMEGRKSDEKLNQI